MATNVAAPHSRWQMCINRPRIFGKHQSLSLAHYLYPSIRSSTDFLFLQSLTTRSPFTTSSTMPSMLPTIDSFSSDTLVHTQPSVVLYRAAEMGREAEPPVIIHAAPVNAYTPRFPSTKLEQNQVRSSSEPISRPATQGSETYRNRYAMYLASIFHISYEAALAESDYQLASGRRSSDDSEPEFSEITRSSSRGQTA